MPTSDPVFRGTITALVTPFQSQSVDYATLDALVDRQLEAGIEGVVPCGSTGESATLTDAEHRGVVAAVIKRVGGRCKVIAGAGSASTSAAIDRVRHAAAAGADGVLVVTPYYNRPSPEGLFRHFAAVVEAADIPIVLYNVPARCGVDMHNEVILRLRSEYENIVSVKDASGGVSRVATLGLRGDIDVLCGDDGLTLAFMAHGAVGVISVLSNLAPRWMKSLVDACAVGDFGQGRAWHERVWDVTEGLGRLGPNPVPVKTAMAMGGLLAEEFRLPLCPLSEGDRERAAALLRRHELL